MLRVLKATLCLWTRTVGLLLAAAGRAVQAV